MRHLLVVAAVTGVEACGDLAGERYAPQPAYANQEPPPIPMNPGYDPIPAPRRTAIATSARWTKSTWAPQIELEIRPQAGGLKMQIADSSVDVLGQRVEGSALIVTLAAPSTPLTVTLHLNVLGESGEEESIVVVVTASSSDPNVAIQTAVSQ